MKKTWVKPHLVTLVKGSPDERILTGCKNASEAVYALPSFSGCVNDQMALCTDCFSTTLS